MNNWKSVLKDLIKIPSISGSAEFKPYIEECSIKIFNLFRSLPKGKTEILKHDNSNPYVFYEYFSGPDKPSLLLYAHYDVQPPMREAVWKTPPFSPSEKDGRIYGRGSADDKAGVVLHLFSVARILEDKNPEVNIKVLIEGQEELGSPDFEGFLKKHKNKLKSDFFLIADLQNPAPGTPSLTISLRGIAVTEVTVRSLRAPVHSGMWGGPVPDPAAALCRIISGLIKKDGSLDIPEIYEGIKTPSKKEKDSFSKALPDEKLFKEQAGMLPGTEINGGKKSLGEKLWRLPSISVNAFEAGNRNAAGNVILDSAWARIGIRIPPGADPEKARSALHGKIKSLCPHGLKVEFTNTETARPWLTDTSHSIFDTAVSVFKEKFNSDVLFTGSGGSIPIVPLFSEYLGGGQALLIGVEDPYSNAHSENESLNICDFEKTLEAQTELIKIISGKQNHH